MSEYLRREETRRDIEAALAARRELGPEYHDSIAAGLAERVEQLAAIRMAELRHEAADPGAGGQARSSRPAVSGWPWPSSRW